MSGDSDIPNNLLRRHKGPHIGLNNSCKILLQKQ